MTNEMLGVGRAAKVWMIPLVCTSALLGCGAAENGAGEEVAQTSEASIAQPAGYGHYCSKTNGTAWSFSALAGATSDPCASLSGTIQRAGIFSVSNYNRAVARCDDGTVWTFQDFGISPLNSANSTAQSSGKTGCVITVTPRELPIFTTPYAGTPTITCDLGFDHARTGTLDVSQFGYPSSNASVVDYRGSDKTGVGVDGHYAWDFCMAAGTRLNAVADGTVLWAGQRILSGCPDGSAGQNEILIRHTVGSGTYQESFISYYAHVQTIGVSTNQAVTSGMQIGTVGSSCTDHPHLHFGVFKETNTIANYFDPTYTQQWAEFGHTTEPTPIDPFGFYPLDLSTGFDPAWRYYPDGAMDINLWNAGPPPTWYTFPVGKQLNVDESLYSTDQRFHLDMQGDGNLVLYEGTTFLWASNTFGTGADHAILQTDGNFVVYTPANVAKFWTGTNGHSNNSLVIQNDGNMVIYDNDQGILIWQSNTGGH